MSESIHLLRRIARAVEARSVGLIDDPPGRRTIFANVVKAPDGCLWYEWDPQAQRPVAVTKTAIRGELINAMCYWKTSSRGRTLKVRVALDCGLTSYEIETSLYSEDSGMTTSGRLLVAGLAAGQAAEAIEEGRRITVQAQQAEQEDARDQVLFLNVYTDAGRVYYDEAPETKQDALGRLRQVREALTLSHDPFDNRIADNSEKGDGNGNGGPPNAGGPPPRGRHPNEEAKAHRGPAAGEDPFGEETQGPDDPLPEADPDLVPCPECDANPHERCQPDRGEALDGPHGGRQALASALAGDGDQFVSLIRPHLERATEPEDARELLIHFAKKCGRFPEAEWRVVRESVAQYHPKAETILDYFREAPEGTSSEGTSSEHR